MRLIFFFLLRRCGLCGYFTGMLLRRCLFLLFLGRLCFLCLGCGRKDISKAARLIMLGKILEYYIQLVILKNLHMVFRSCSIVG